MGDKFLRHALKTLIRSCFIALACAATLTGCSRDPYHRQEDILAHARVDLISDAPYLFPANKNSDDPTTYLSLRRWDIIFTGAIKPDPTKPELAVIDALIPGDFNHILVYLGKDADGFAYAAELNTDNIAIVDRSVRVDGGIRLLALSRDLGADPQPTGKHVLDRAYYVTRWAKTFRDEERDKLVAADESLTQTIQDHLLAHLPYQLEFSIPLKFILFNRTVRVVDDGLAYGAGCADYWTTIFEDVAGLCMRGVRARASELIDYYQNDPVGRDAALPEQWNPIGTGSLKIRDALALGFDVNEDPPHRFRCGGQDESGLVLPDRIYQSEALADIAEVTVAAQ